MTSQYELYTTKTCHTGNTKLYTEPKGGSLYIGGWNQGASFNWNTHVIDLTGTEHKYWEIPFAYDEESKKFMPFLSQSYAGWLSLPFPDYQVPQGMNTLEQWQGIAKTIQDILKKGRDVLVACHGGHGRSGLFCAIVCYLLAVKKDRSWSSPVEKIRQLHCKDAVETFQQEKFVYEVLGLNITITHSYFTPSAKNFKYETCPICGTSSSYIQDCGMCYSCRSKYSETAPLRHDLTLEDIKHKGEIDHSCVREKCMGIWRADVCKHVTHDMIIYEGLCEICWQKAEAESMELETKAAAENTTASNTDEFMGLCAICQRKTMYAHRFGVCYDCASALTKSGEVDFVHNTMTDPYVAVPHHCEDLACVGVVIADVCGHLVHNMEIEDGKCPECRTTDQKRGHTRGITHTKEDE